MRKHGEEDAITMFSSFSNKDFRIYVIGMFVSFCGTWIQSIAQSWLVYDLSNSSFLLGLVGFVNYSPMLLLSLFSGVLVDRTNRRHILILTQIAFMLLALVLAIFTQFKIVTVNFILLLSLIQGIVLSFDAPARQSLIFELVGKENILNAIALNSVAFHSARMLGPALAGILVAVINISGCFYINTITYLPFIIALLLIRPAFAKVNNNRNHFLVDLKSGLEFIKNNKVILILISFVGVVSLFGFSYVVLLPVFAKTVLNSGIKTYGLLMSASGVGSILGGLRLASLKQSKQQNKILIFSLYCFAFSLIIFSFSKTLIFSMLILVFMGFSSLSSLAIINSIVQTIVPNEFRGRVMSLYMLTFAGTIPFGSLVAGSLAHMVGVSLTLLICGIACLILFLLFTKKIANQDFSQI